MKQATGYVFRGVKLEDNIAGALDRYFSKHISPGSFTTAILANDLVDTFAYAHPLIIPHIPIIVAYLVNEAPSNAWGNYEKVRTWLI